MAFQISPSSGRYQPMSEINVTPFVDVMLVLLIIFMITAPMMTSTKVTKVSDVRQEARKEQCK